MRIQIRTNFRTPAGSTKSTLEVEASDTVREVIQMFVEKEGIKTDGCWSGLCFPNQSYLHPAGTLFQHHVQSGNTLEYHQGKSASGHGSAATNDPFNTVRGKEASLFSSVFGI